LALRTRLQAQFVCLAGQEGATRPVRRGLDLLVSLQQRMVNSELEQQGESDCLIKTEHCEGLLGVDTM